MYKRYQGTDFLFWNLCASGLLQPLPTLRSGLWTPNNAENGPSFTSALPAMLASLSSLTRSIRSAHMLMRTSIPECLLALVGGNESTSTPLSSPILISVMREWASTNWNATRQPSLFSLPSPIFEEECTSVLEISVSILLLLAETPPDVADEAEGRGGEGGSGSVDGRRLIAALSGNSASKIISSLALATVNVTPRAQRLSERLLFRINPGVRHQSMQSTGGLVVYSAGIHGKQAQPQTQRQAQVAEESMDGFLQWMYVNSETKRQSLTRSLIPSLSLSAPSPSNADPKDHCGLMYIHKESRHGGRGGGEGGRRGGAETMPLSDPLYDTGEIERGRRDEIGRLHAAVTDADSREAAAREEVLRGKDEMTDLWGRLVSAKERPDVLLMCC